MIIKINDYKSEKKLIVFYSRDRISMNFIENRQNDELIDIYLNRKIEMIFMKMLLLYFNLYNNFTFNQIRINFLLMLYITV